ncbi:unnamed protein product [Parnassius mnemosyne]|uniref:Reverse transcriptase domain-containing protein n=1 Tax=Parnassius mnemosyne TaxID=213953 RepID=A0AAV1KN44_9NEOP
MDRGRAATQECLRTASTLGYSIILMQEPYIGNKNNVSVGSQFRVIQKTSKEIAKPVRSAIVILNQNLNFVVNPNLVSEDIVGVTIRLGQTKVGIISIYLHEKTNIEEDVATIKRLITTMDADEYILGGDANANSIWWGCKADDRRGTTIMEAFAELSFEILNTGTKPTFSVYRRGEECSSIIDITACSTTFLHKIKNWTVNEHLCTLSSHRPITFEIHLQNTNTKQINKSTRKYNTIKADWIKFTHEFKEELNRRDINVNTIREIKLVENLNEIVDSYTHSILYACDKAIPLTKTKLIKTAVWWNKEITEMKKETIRRRRRIRNANPNRRQYVIEQYQEAKAKYKSMIEEAATNSWKTLCTKEEKENLWQRTYRIIKICTKREEDKLLRDIGGTILTERKSAELLAETFYPNDYLDTDTNEQVELRNRSKQKAKQLENSIINIKQPFTAYEIESIFKNMSPKKAPGDDGLTSDICQTAFASSPEILIALLNQCLNIGYFPAQWKTATIKVIPKPNKEDYTLPKSYRPIGLLPILGKVLEKLFVNRLQWQLGAEGKMSRRQYGFTPQRSTEDALYDMLTIIKEGISKKQIVALVSLDIEGAFDSAWWPAIINQLSYKDVDESVLRLITSYLTGRKIKLRYAGEEVVKHTNKGCIQGSTCGPILWNILLDSLLQDTQNTRAHVQAFADDIVIIGIAKTGQQLERDINETLSIIAAWGKIHKMKFAAHKTQAMIITKQIKYHRPQLLLEGIELKYSNYLKILGLTIDENINFKQHLDNISQKAVNLYKMISRAARAQWGLNSEIVRTIYLAVVEPTILYAASCWVESTNKNRGNQRCFPVRTPPGSDERVIRITRQVGARREFTSQHPVVADVPQERSQDRSLRNTARHDAPTSTVTSPIGNASLLKGRVLKALEMSKDTASTTPPRDTVSSARALTT